MRNELEKRFYELTGGRADNRWKDETLQKKVSELEISEKARQEAEAAREKEVAEKEASRLARIELRGDAETFADISREGLSDEDLELRFFIRKALAWAEAADVQIEKFTAKIQEDPFYALSWSISEFKHAGRLKVAKTVIHHFNNGATMEGLQSMATREALRGARNPSMSTSPTSNLAHQCETEAWAEITERY